MAAGFQGNRDIQAEFTGWQRSRLLWHQQLYGVLCGTPTNVQLQTLTVSQTLQLTNDTPTRAFAMTLGGRGNGAEIEADVKRLQAYLGSGPVYTGLTSRVTIPVYGADMDPKAKREDRVFQILCQYHERLFK